ncbi:MAG: hypothetical protein Q4B70_09125, partial [Lachnospiraceae bacterium]|nr:hypothetical protein [Lachnospiraceae bacterium]
NLKIASEIYNQMVAKNIHNFDELDARLQVLNLQAKTANSTIVSIEQQMRELAEIIKYAEQYQETKTFYNRYEKAKDQDRFLRRYESQIILFSGAERMLQRMGINPEHMDLKKLKEQYNLLLDKKKQLSSLLKSTLAETKELEYVKENMSKYLDLLPERHDVSGRTNRPIL